MQLLKNYKMFFTVENMPAANPHKVKFKIIHDARFKLALFPMRANELQLSKFFQEKYGKTLKQICYGLLNRCTVSADEDNNYTVAFIRREDDDMAALITYGNEKLPGSQILKFMFKNPKIRKD